MGKKLTMTNITNFNEFTEEATRREGGKVNMNIAQVKEASRIFFDLAFENPVQFSVLLGKEFIKREKKVSK